MTPTQCPKSRIDEPLTSGLDLVSSLLTEGPAISEQALGPDDKVQFARFFERRPDCFDVDL
jgi:hypothetical protein